MTQHMIDHSDKSLSLSFSLLYNHNLYRVKKCLSSRNDYVNARNYLTKLIKVHKITYYKDRLVNADNKIMFSLIQSLVSIETRALPDFNSLYDGCVVFSYFFSEKVKMLVMNLENNNIYVEIPVFLNNTLSDLCHTYLWSSFTNLASVFRVCQIIRVRASPGFQFLTMHEVNNIYNLHTNDKPNSMKI